MAEVIRQRAQVFNKPVGVIRTQGGAQQLGQTISSVASGLTQQAYRVAADDAQKRGIEVAQSVEEKNLLTFDPETGKPEVFTPPPAFGRIAANAYQEIIDKRFTDSMNSELQLKAKEISLKFQYNPDAYDDVFSDYIGAMSENATGKYKQFIESTGADYLARTKLNIQQRVQAQARSNLAQAASNSARKGAENAYELARTGGFNPNEGEEISATQGVLEAEVSNVSRAVATNLLKVGADGATRDSISLGVAMGGIEFLLGETNTSAERNALELAIRTRGREVSGVPKELRAQLDNLLPYVDGGNINKVLTHASGVSADYNAVERDQIIASTKAAELAARAALIESEGTSNNAGFYSSFAARNGFKGADNSAVYGAVSSISNEYDRIADGLTERFNTDVDFKSEDYRGQLNELKRDMLSPLLLQASRDGNTGELFTAIATGFPKDMENLSTKQQAFVRSLRSSSMFDAVQDMGFIKNKLGEYTNAPRETLQREEDAFNLGQDVTAVSGRLSDGTVSEEELGNQIDAIKNGIKTRAISAIQGQSLINKLNRNAAFGELNAQAQNLTSTDLVRLASYIDTSGNRKEGLPKSLTDIGDKMLEATTADDVEALTGRINGLASTVSREESAAIERQKLQINFERLSNGRGSANSTQDQNDMQEIFDIRGIRMEDFSKLPSDLQSQVYSMLKGAQPTSFLKKLKDIASGIEVEGTDELMDLFARLDNDATRDGVMHSRFGNSLGDAQAILQDVNEIHFNTGEKRSVIAAELIAFASSNRTPLAIENALGGKTPQAYINDRFNDPVLAIELESTVKWLASSGKSQSAINTRLDNMVNKTYPKVKYVVDPSMPVGDLKRSRNALSIAIPDDDAREAFLTKIESDLPFGYSLYADEINTQQAMAGGLRQFANSQEEFDKAVEASERPDVTQVYLVPNKGIGGLTYYVYRVDKNNELEPLIYDATPVSRFGEKPKPVRMFPAYDLSELNDYYGRTEAEGKAEMDRNLQLKAETLADQRVNRVQNISDIKNAPRLWWDAMLEEFDRTNLIGN